MPYDRSLGEVVDAARDATLEGIRKCAVGVVTAVHGAFVDVQLTVNTPLIDEYETATFELAPVFGSVQLCTLRGGGFCVWVPVAVGDSVLVVFTDLSTDTWRAGDGSRAVNPGWVGRHTADSPFAIPMIAPDAKALASAGNSKMIVGVDGGTAIAIGPSDIELGGNSDAIALASKVATELTKIQTAMASLTVTTGPGTGGTVIASTPYVPGAVASAIVKAS